MYLYIYIYLYVIIYFSIYNKFQEYCTNLDGKICIRSVTDTLRNLKVQSHLSEVFKPAKLVLVLPATNATSEKTFALLKLIKS